MLLIIAVILGAAAKKTLERQKLENLTYVVPLKEIPKPEPPKIVPPKVIPPPPVVKLIEPKILKPEVKIEAPKPVPMKPMETPKPAVAPAPPKVVVAAAAPKPMPVHLGQSASVPNHDVHPAAVALGSANNPIAPSNRAATAAVNLGQRGLAGMPSTNTGGGPPAQAVSLGSGQPGGSLGGRGSTAVVGVRLGGVTNGVPGSNGNGVGNRAATVQLGRTETPASLTQVRAEHPPVRSGASGGLQAASDVHGGSDGDAPGRCGLRSDPVSSSGTVSVVGVTNGLGHGLDESAVHAVQMTRFKPAVDATGSPMDWEGVVNISFQIAS